MRFLDHDMIQQHACARLSSARRINLPAWRHDMLEKSPQWHAAWTPKASTKQHCFLTQSLQEARLNSSSTRQHDVFKKHPTSAWPNRDTLHINSSTPGQQWGTHQLVHQAAGHVGEARHSGVVKL